MIPVPIIHSCDTRTFDEKVKYTECTWKAWEGPINSPRSPSSCATPNWMAAVQIPEETRIILQASLEETFTSWHGKTRIDVTLQLLDPDTAFKMMSSGSLPVPKGEVPRMDDPWDEFQTIIRKCKLP